MDEFIRHPAPNGYLRGRQGWRGGTVHGRWSAERVVSLLSHVHPNTMTGAQLARALEAPPYIVDQMALTAWRNGRVEFAVGTFDLLYRAIPETPPEGERFRLQRIRNDQGRKQYVVLDTSTGERHVAPLPGRVKADTLCRQLNKEKSNVSERTDAEFGSS